jgi:hypothetical protein
LWTFSDECDRSSTAFEFETYIEADQEEKAFFAEKMNLFAGFCKSVNEFYFASSSIVVNNFHHIFFGKQHLEDSEAFVYWDMHNGQLCYRCIFLNQQQATEVKEAMKMGLLTDCAFISMDAKPTVLAKTLTSEDCEIHAPFFKNAVWWTHFFNGDISYLIQNKEQTIRTFDSLTKNWANHRNQTGKGARVASRYCECEEARSIVCELLLFLAAGRKDFGDDAIRETYSLIKHTQILHLGKEINNAIASLLMLVGHENSNLYDADVRDLVAQFILDDDGRNADIIMSAIPDISDPLLVYAFILKYADEDKAFDKLNSMQIYDYVIASIKEESELAKILTAAMENIGKTNRSGQSGVDDRKERHTNIAKQAFSKFFEKKGSEFKLRPANSDMVGQFDDPRTAKTYLYL